MIAKQILADEREQKDGPAVSIRSSLPDIVEAVAETMVTQLVLCPEDFISLQREPFCANLQVCSILLMLGFDHGQSSNYFAAMVTRWMPCCVM